MYLGAFKYYDSTLLNFLDPPPSCHHLSKIAPVITQYLNSLELLYNNILFKFQSSKYIKTHIYIMYSFVPLKFIPLIISQIR